MALPNEDQFSEEKFMVGDNSEKMYNPEPKLGEAFETMDPEKLSSRR
jgi:fructose-specific component phosphotransferase system IIB-like protein